MPRILAFAEGDVPVALRRQVRAAQEEAWPSATEAEAASLAPQHDPALHPRSLILLEGDAVLSALDVLSTRIEHAGSAWAASGLSSVVTPSAHRGRGHARELVSQARVMLVEQVDIVEPVGNAERFGPRADVVLFTCDRPLQGFYEACGFEVLPGTVLVGGTPQDPFPSDGPGMDTVTLGAFVTPAAVRARGRFVGARIGLYSGPIDRLW